MIAQPHFNHDYTTKDPDYWVLDHMSPDLVIPMGKGARFFASHWERVRIARMLSAYQQELEAHGPTSGIR